MKDIFSQFGVDPVIGANIMSVVGLGTNDLKDIGRFNKLKTIIQHFSGLKNGRKQALSILSGNHGDRLNALWTWVELQREKQETLKSLDPQEFAEDVAGDIVGGHIPKKKIDLIKEQVNTQIKEKKEEALQEKAEGAATKKAMKLEKIKKTISQLDLIEEALDEYGN